MATQYRIFPSIGIARLGEDSDFILSPEIPGSGPIEFDNGGSPIRVTRFKDASKRKIRKQGARFYLFESDDGQTWKQSSLPASSITWSVTLTNKKSAVTRPPEPPIVHTRPTIADAKQIIDGGTKKISGSRAVGDVFKGTYKTTAADGSLYQVDVELGQLQTDAAGRLIVLGGKGFSSAPPNSLLGRPPNTYYRNPNWHDDVADGPVTAEIRVRPDDTPVQADNGAWVIVAPPDYAPEINGVVTLYDVLLQIGIDSFGLAKPGTPSFDLDIAPIISRIKRLRWVHDNANWSDDRLDSPKLRSKADTDRTFRDGVRDLILSVETILKGHTDPHGPQFKLRQFQKDFLDAWVQGQFSDAPADPPSTISAAGLTRAALEGAVGQGFCPGIEAGIILLDTTLYSTPFDFRLKHDGVAAGDLTALMAQPWQSDFLKCNTEWWPSQRPDLAPQNDESTKDWIRGAGDHKLLVQKSASLGFIVKQGAQEVFVEAERDPTLPERP